MKALICALAALLLLTGCGDKETKTQIPGHVDVIRAARADIAPVDDSLLQKITEEYNIHVKAGSKWPEWARNCVAYRDLFESAERLTLYPAEFIAGMAMHESAGCKSSASDWAGGRGFMQITTPPNQTEKRDAAAILSIDVKDLDWKGNDLHNIIIGIIRLDGEERRFGSRSIGLLAYNRGAGNVRRDIRKLEGRSWNYGDTPPTMVDLKPYVPYTRKMKPRVYAQKILAAVAMMDRALRGKDITRIEGRLLRPEEIPGFDPSRDGEDIEDLYAAQAASSR